MKTFKSILQFQKEFDTDAKCRAYLEESLWNGTPCCPFCASTNVHRFPNGVTLKCREKVCRKKFTVTVGTIYENTKLPLTKWFLATYILSVHSKGISSHQLATMLDVTQKTAWFLNHRIREMLAEKAPQVLENMVEVDETAVGGKRRNKHAWERKELAEQFGETGSGEKAIVAGIVERGGKVIAKVVPNTDAETLVPFMVDNVKQGATVNTDEHRSYTTIGTKGFTHETISHSEGEYVRGKVHTNTIEGFWSLLKRQIVGIHHNVSPKHLQRYCNEAGYRYNNRGNTQDVRFSDALSRAAGRLKYQDLIAD
ncbi:MAG: IS1595 family transposase [Chitinophagales bacterium]